MIITAVALLAVATVTLIAGIARSSVALLVLSALATAVAAGLSFASFGVYRRAAAGDVEPAPRPGWPDAYGPAPNGAHAPASTVPPPAASPGPAGLVPIERWDGLKAGEAIRWVQALGLEELHAVRRHEIEHAARVTVLRAIDERITSIVELRKGAGSSA